MEASAIRIDGEESGRGASAALLAERLAREMEEEGFGCQRGAERLAGVLRAARVRRRSAWGGRPAAAGSRRPVRSEGRAANRV